MRHTTRGLIAITFAATLASATPSLAGTVEVRPSARVAGDHWTTLRAETQDVSIERRRLESSVLWDVRPWLVDATPIDWSVASDGARGLVSCATDRSTSAGLGCRMHDGSIGAAPRGRIIGETTVAPPGATEDGAIEALIAGGRLRLTIERDGTTASHEIVALAEGVTLLPAGPREALLVRERFAADDGDVRLRYRFLAADGFELARLEGPAPLDGAPFTPTTVEALSQDGRANDGMTLSYQTMSDALSPGATAFVQRSISADTALSTLDPGWTDVAAMIAPDATNVSTGPDPSDPSTQVTLPEVWEFGSLDLSSFDIRTFYSIRDDTGWSGCLNTCSTQGAGETDWQAYLKIDRYGPASTLQTRDIFLLNDNDTGADPSIDVPFVAKDELNFESDSRLQVCFADSVGGTDLLRFFQFSGASPAAATLGVGDSWLSGNWTSCNDGSGLRLTLSSACGNTCYPGCPDGLADPRARGLFTGGAGFRAEIIEDGWIHTPTGNYLPALLMRQDTDLEAGANFFGTCNISTQRSRSFDYFWLNEDYGFLGLVSSPDNNVIAPDDWSANANLADGADVTWGPFPPPELRAEACLGATRVSWTLPADGSNLDDDPGISDAGYVVAWGNLPDADALADFASNPNHTPLPGDAGYLAGPPGAEPTSYVINGWPGATLDATVVSGMRYTDPDAGDITPYTSTAQYRVVADPAQLDALTFRVGPAVAPFVATSGGDLQLDWPAVAGASGYLVTVYDLATDAALPCPATMNCVPSSASTTHGGAASDAAGYAYRVWAVDACGGASTD